MTQNKVDAALARFSASITTDTQGDAPFVALQDLARRLIGAKLFTILTIDMENEVYRRRFTSNPVIYPVSTTKAIDYNDWFDLVCRDRKPFVANSLAVIAALFRDHATIASLGYGSVINLPVVVDDELLGTVNCTDVEGFYTPEKVALSRYLDLPAKVAFLLTRNV